MANIDAKNIQNLLDQIVSLQRTIAKAGDEGRDKARGIKVAEACEEIPMAAEGKVDPTAWLEKGEEKQKELHQRLTYVRDSLSAAADSAGPVNPKHIMYNKYASNAAVVIWTIVGFAAVCLLLMAIVLNWNKATGTDFTKEVSRAIEELGRLEALNNQTGAALSALNESETELKAAEEEDARQAATATHDELKAAYENKLKEAEEAQNRMKTEAVEAIKKIRNAPVQEDVVLTMVILLGALGGSLHFAGSLVKYIGNRQLKRSWLLYYLATPLTGAGLAAIVYMLLRVGLISPSGKTTEGSGIANLNLIAIYSFAALTGLFSKAALEKLADVFKTLFRADQASTKDALAGEKPGQPTSSAE